MKGPINTFIQQMQSYLSDMSMLDFVMSSAFMKENGLEFYNQDSYFKFKNQYGTFIVTQKNHKGISWFIGNFKRKKFTLLKSFCSVDLNYVEHVCPDSNFIIDDKEINKIYNLRLDLYEIN
tara:strand:- start:207825 stop:208187 length:363 start_codon:yes stop_codon:yes gene_type:complete